MRNIRHLLMILAVVGWFGYVLQAQSEPLAVERQGNSLRFSAPRMHFLEGKPLDQLHNGAALTYVFDLSLIPAQQIDSSSALRKKFIVSFDLWEERFAVVEEGTPGRSVSHLTQKAAEAWCLDNLSLPVAALPSEKSFMVKLECWIEQNRTGTDSEGGLTLASLIDIFSRKGHSAPPHWRAVSGPLRLSDLK